MASKPNFNLKNRTDDPALIIMVFRFKGRRVVMSTSLTVPQKFWNTVNQRVRANRDFPRHKAFNQRLNLFESKTIKLWDEYHAQGIIPTAKEFKAELTDRIRDVHREAPSLIPFIEQFIEERKQMNMKPGSIQVYRNCLKNLQAYQEARKKKLNFDLLNSAFVNNFTAYLFAQNFADGYVHKILTTLKTLVKEADKRGFYEGSPLLKTSLNVKKRAKDNIYLTEAEIKTLYEMQLSGRLANVRDLFLVVSQDQIDQ